MQAQDSGIRLRRIAHTAITVSVIAVMVLFIGFVVMHASKPGGWVTDVAVAHFAAVIALPFAALLAAFIVVAFESRYGAIEFHGLGLKFAGASGPIVLWVLCYLSIASTIRLLW